MRKERSLAFRAARWCVVGPVVATRSLARLIVLLGGSWVLWTRDALRCPGCHAEVPLYGFFRCDWCDASFLGHAFAPCPAPGCGAVPAWIPCPRCEHSIYNPRF